MSRLPLVVVFLFAPIAVHAADDDWVGLTVFSTSDRLPLRDADGKTIGDFSYHGTVTRDLGEWIEVRHIIHPGPYVGRVKKSEVVKLEDADKYFTGRIKANAKDIWALRNRANARVFTKNFVGAIDDLTSAIEVDPHESLYVERGRVKRAKGDLDGAISDYTEAIKLAPGNEVALNNRGVVWELKGKPRDAIDDYTAAIESNPKYATPYRNRGLIHQRQGDYKLAAKDFEECVTLEPESATAIDDLAWLLATCPEAAVRNGKKAVTLAKQAASLTQNRDMVILETLAAAYAETENFALAVETQKLVTANEAYMKKYGDDVRMKLKLYEEKKPYRTAPVKGKGPATPPKPGADLPRSAQK